MLSPSVYTPPRSLHHSTRIFHCWKQCCRSSSDSLFMSSIAFFFTASTNSNLVPLNTDLICGNKKSHMEVRLVSTVDVPTRWSCASSKTSWQTALCAGALSWWRIHELFFYISDLVLTCSRSFVKTSWLMVWPSGTQSTWTIPWMFKKTIIIALNLDLLCHAFFCLGELGLFQCMDWCLRSGSYWKNHDLSQVITFSKKSGPFSVFWRMSAQMLIWISFCSGVRSLGTIFEHTFFMLKLLCKICRTVSLSVLINSATAWMLRQRFCCTISPTSSMLVPVFDLLGRPGFWSSAVSSLPSLNL